MTNQLRTPIQWLDLNQQQSQLLRVLTIEQSIQQFVALQSEFEPWLQETEPFFRQERNTALIQLQTRLMKAHQARPITMQGLITSLVQLQDKLEKAAIPSVVIGGIAVGIWGEPRLTRDIDLKVLISRQERDRLLAQLDGYTTLHANPDETLQRNGVAFFLDAQGTRIDVMLADTAFDEMAISRAKQVEALPSQMIRVCSAEDLILYKMISSRTKDRADVESIIQRQKGTLDDQYVEKWLREFEQALDDSTLIKEYRRLRKRFK